MRHHDRVDVGRRDVDRLQVLSQAPDVLSLPGEPRVHEHGLAAAADHEAIDGQPRRGEAELAEMGALAGCPIGRDQIVERDGMDAVIDRAHDNVPDGNVRDAAWLSGRLHVDILLSLGRCRYCLFGGRKRLRALRHSTPRLACLRLARLANRRPNLPQRSEKPRSRRKSLNTSRPVSAASSLTRSADCSVQSATRIFCSA